MIVNITIYTKDLSALSTLDYWCNNPDDHDVDYNTNFEAFDKEKYYKNLEEKRKIKDGDNVYLTDCKYSTTDVVLTIEHYDTNCRLNGILMPYAYITLIK